MSGAGPHRLNASFIAATRGKLFCVDHLPPAGQATRGCVLLLSPFAEELNKSRRMIALAAGRLAAAGWWVRVADLFGCGDSPGEFVAATWDGWVDDLAKLAADAQRSSGGALWLWGVRSGALLVAPLFERLPQAHVLLWQPTLSGRQMLTQFLRLKVAAGMLGETKGAGVNQLRDALLQGGPSLEVAGYELSSVLARAVDRAAWGLPSSFGGRLAWLEVAQDESAALSPAAQMQIDKLRAAGITVDAAAVTGPAFWQTSEISECPALIEQTVARLEATHDAAVLNS